MLQRGRLLHAPDRVLNFGVTLFDIRWIISSAPRTCCIIELKACPLQATDTPHPAIVETDSKRKIAMLYVLDSMLQSGKAREKQTKEMDPDIIKSMQRFCNAVAVGLPTLVRSTQNDPGCYAKTLKVCCSPSSAFRAKF